MSYRSAQKYKGKHLDGGEGRLKPISSGGKHLKFHQNEDNLTDEYNHKKLHLTSDYIFKKGRKTA